MNRRYFAALVHAVLIQPSLPKAVDSFSNTSHLMRIWVNERQRPVADHPTNGDKKIFSEKIAS
jgi:hypothetical protein